MSPKAPALLTEDALRYRKLLDIGTIAAADLITKVGTGRLDSTLDARKPPSERSLELMGRSSIEAEVRTLAAAEQEPVLWQYRHVNGLNSWEEVKPWSRIQTLEQRVAALREFAYQGQRMYEVRALYAAQLLREQGEENDGSAHPVDAASTTLPLGSDASRGGKP